MNTGTAICLQSIFSLNNGMNLVVDQILHDDEVLQDYRKC